MRIRLTLSGLLGLVFVGCLAPAHAPGSRDGYYRDRWFIDRDDHRWRDHRGRDHDHYDHHRHERDPEHGHRTH